MSTLADERQDIQYDIYVSYSKRERSWVNDWLIPHLEAAGLRTCFAERDFLFGAPQIKEKERAVSTSRRTLLVITTAYLQDEWANFDSVLARSLDPGAIHQRVIPLVLEDVTLPRILSTLVPLDFTQEDERTLQMERLVHAFETASGVRHSPRVLVVEDEARWLALERAILSSFDVDEANTAADAIAKLSADEHYGLVLVNLHLTEFEEGSGEEVLEFIRDSRPSLPRIVITGKEFHAPIFEHFFEQYQITELLTKGDQNVPYLRQIIRKYLSPLQTGTLTLQIRKAEVLILLQKAVDEALSRTNRGLRELEQYRVQLRRQIGNQQAEEITEPDKQQLLTRRENQRNKYREIADLIGRSRTLDELERIAGVIEEDW